MTAGSKTQHHQDKFPNYAGRPPYSSVATGSKVRLSVSDPRRIPADVDLFFQSQHKLEIQNFMNRALSDKKQSNRDVV